MKQYDPIPIRPMRLRGVFGITWNLYKRGFWGMFFYCLLFLGVFILLSSLLSTSTFTEQIYEMADMIGISPMNMGRHDIAAPEPFIQTVEIAAQGIGAFLLSMLLSLINMMLVQPILQGGMYTEISCHAYGNASGFGGMMRRCGYMLKRFFSTQMTFWLVSIGIGFVFSILFVIALLGCLFSVGFSLAFSGVELGAGTIVLILFVVFLLLLLMVAATLFLSFLYPVAVNEGVYNFKALGRSFKLVAKRFWRVLGTNLLTMLIVFIATAAVCTGYILILASTMLDETVSLILFTVLLAVIEAFYFPYAASLSTALYFDARARFPEPPAPEYCPGFDSRNMDHYAPQTQPSGEAAAIPRENPEERKPEE